MRVCFSLAVSSLCIAMALAQNKPEPSLISAISERMSEMSSPEVSARIFALRYWASNGASTCYAIEVAQADAEHPEPGADRKFKEELVHAVDRCISAPEPVVRNEAIRTLWPWGPMRLQSVRRGEDAEPAYLILPRDSRT